MKSIRRFNKKWKWGVIGVSIAAVTVGGLSLGIALSAENKSVDISSNNFVGNNVYQSFYKKLQILEGNNSPTSSSSFWQKVYENKNLTDWQNSFNLLNTYDNSNILNMNLLKNIQKNLINQELNNHPLALRYYTLNTSNFFNSNITSFTNGAFHAVGKSTNNLVQMSLVPKSPTEDSQVYYYSDGELVTMFWSPDYNDISTWIGYLFAANNSYCTGNLWPCLWAYLAGANPYNGSFACPSSIDLNNISYNPITSNPTFLPYACLKQKNVDQNYPTFAQQLYATNARRKVMGLPPLPGWAASIYQDLYTTFGNSIAWNTPFGWWPMQYNENQMAQELQYALERWCTGAESDSYSYSLNVNNNVSINAISESDYVPYSTPIQYTSQGAIVKLIQWINSLVPILPFYSGGNNNSLNPILTQKNLSLIENPGNGLVNAQYFINNTNNKEAISYNAANPFVYFEAAAVYGANPGYFTPVLGSDAFYNFAPQMYSGLMNFAPYNYSENSLGQGQYSYNPILKNQSGSIQTLMKLEDANNLILGNPLTNFKAASYNQAGNINHGDNLIYFANNLSQINAEIQFVANPLPLINQKLAILNKPLLKTQNGVLTYQQYKQYVNNTVAPGNIVSWSNYSNYINFMRYKVLSGSDIHLTTAEKTASFYQYVLNPHLYWYNENGKATENVVPEDFLNSVTWMAATYAAYSYDSAGQTPSQLQANSYLLQEMGVAGNEYYLGVGSGFFQTEEYSANSSTTGNTFTYFLSPQNLNQSQTQLDSTGWMVGQQVCASGNAAVPYFLSMVATDGAYLDPLPSNVQAFSSAYNPNAIYQSNYLPANSKEIPTDSYQNNSTLTIGSLNQEFMGTSSTTGVWNLSTLMGNALRNLTNAQKNQNQTLIAKYQADFNRDFNAINELPVYQGLIANENVTSKSWCSEYLYGYGVNINTQKPEMPGNLLFNGGYYACAGSFTLSSIKMNIIPNYFDQEMQGMNITLNSSATQITNTPTAIPLFGPASQKLGSIQFKWDANVTPAQELIMYRYNQIDNDFGATVQELLNFVPTGNQAVYYQHVTKNLGTNLTLYNALIFTLAQNNMPANQSGQPLIVVGNSSNEIDVRTFNNTTYAALPGFPMISSNGNVLYTNPDETTASLKLYDTKAYEDDIVGTALNPFIYGTKGAMIRQDINALVDWQMIASTASYPLKQTIICNSFIPFGNFLSASNQSYLYAYMVNNNSVSNQDDSQPLPTNFYEYAASVPGMGVVGPSLYCTIHNNNQNNQKMLNLCYEEESSIYWNQWDQILNGSAQQAQSITAIPNIDATMSNGYSQYEWEFMNNAVSDWQTGGANA